MAASETTPSGADHPGDRDSDHIASGPLNLNIDHQQIPQVSVTSPTTIASASTAAPNSSSSPPQNASSSSSTESTRSPPSHITQGPAQAEHELPYSDLEVVPGGEEEAKRNEEANFIGQPAGIREPSMYPAQLSPALQGFPREQEQQQRITSPAPQQGHQMLLHSDPSNAKSTNLQPDEPPMYGQGQQKQYQPQQQQQRRQQPVPQRQHFDYAVPLHMLTASTLPVDCPVCHTRGLTSIEHVSGGTTHLWAAVVCFCTCLGCCMYLFDSLKDVEHSCSKCHTLLATWHRSGDVEVHAKGTAPYPGGPHRPPQQQLQQGAYPPSPQQQKYQQGGPGYQMSGVASQRMRSPQPGQQYMNSAPLPRQQNQYSQQQEQQQYIAGSPPLSSATSPRLQSPSTVSPPPSALSSPQPAFQRS